MRLDISVLSMKQLFGPLNSQGFGYVHTFTAAVVPPLGITFGVFIGKKRTLSFKYRLAGLVFRGDKVYCFPMALNFLVQGMANFRVYLA